jgi:Transcriptional regulators
MFNYTQLPDELFTIELFATLSLHAKVLYSFMLRRVSISKNNQWIDDGGYVYIHYRVDEIMEKFNCSNKTATKIMSELEEMGLIDKKRQGQGKPDIIYVNKFSTIDTEQKETETQPEDQMEQGQPLALSEQKNTGETTANPEVKKVHSKKCKKYTSKNEENTLQEVKNLHANYKDNNYKESVINSSSHTKEEEYKKMLKFQEAAGQYSAQIAETAFEELMKRDEGYRKKFNSAMFLKVCRTIAQSHEPVLSVSGFVNWCYDNINFSPPMKNKGPDQFGQFMRREYDLASLEEEILNNNIT